MREKSIKQQRAEALAGGPASSNRLLGESTRGRHVRLLVTTDVAAAFDAVTLCELLTNRVLIAHRAAIEGGVRADGGGSQPALNPDGGSGADAKAGRRPSLRGVTAKRAFPRTLQRTAPKVAGTKMSSGRQGTRAKATISAAPVLRGWLQREQARGVGYFQSGGEIRELAQRVLLEWADADIQQT